MNKLVGRRRFLRGLGQAGLVAGVSPWLMSVKTVSAKSADNLLNAEELATVADLSYRLLPLMDASAPVYQAVALSIQEQIKQRPGTVDMVRSGLVALNSASGKQWLQLPTAARIMAMDALVDSPLIGMIRWTTSELVLRDKEVWKQLGYQGSAIEHGGYLHRGFDDIDWLPEQGSIMRGADAK